MNFSITNHPSGMRVGVLDGKLWRFSTAIALTAFCCLRLCAQTGGTVSFANNSSTKVINAQTGTNVSSADGIQAALYWAPLGSSNLAQIGPPAVVGSPLPGIFAGGTRTTGTSMFNGTVGQFQVRAWSGGYASYEEAQQHSGALLGQSAVFQNPTGNPLADPPLPPYALLGLQTFSLTVHTVICTNCGRISVTKNCPPNPVPPGGVLTFTGTVTNTGLFALTNVLVVNNQPASNTIVFGPVTLAVNTGATFTNSYRVAACACGPFTDTLTAFGIGPDGVTYSNSVTATCPGTNAYPIPGDLNGDGIIDQNELNAVLSNYWTHNAIYMTNPASLGGGLFQFTLTNITGWNFTVLVSSNMNDWTNLPSQAVPVFQFLDPAAVSNAPQRFYRLQYP